MKSNPHSREQLPEQFDDFIKMVRLRERAKVHPDAKVIRSDNIFDSVEHYLMYLLQAYTAQQSRQIRKEVEAEAIKTVEKTQLRMRPMILLDEPEGKNYAMYWDDEQQVWNRARYKDLVIEAKRQLEPLNLLRAKEELEKLRAYKQHGSICIDDECEDEGHGYDYIDADYIDDAITQLDKEIKASRLDAEGGE